MIRMSHNTVKILTILHVVAIIAALIGLMYFFSGCTPQQPQHITITVNAERPAVDPWPAEEKVFTPMAGGGAAPAPPGGGR